MRNMMLSRLHPFSKVAGVILTIIVLVSLSIGAFGWQKVWAATGDINNAVGWNLTHAGTELALASGSLRNALGEKNPAPALESARQSMRSAQYMLEQLSILDKRHTAQWADLNRALLNLGWDLQGIQIGLGKSGSLTSEHREFINLGIGFLRTVEEAVDADRKLGKSAKLVLNDAAIRVAAAEAAQLPGMAQSDSSRSIGQSQKLTESSPSVAGAPVVGNAIVRGEGDHSDTTVRIEPIDDAPEALEAYLRTLEAVTDPQGSFRFDEIPQGAYILIFTRPGYPTVSSEPFKVEPTDAITIPTVTLAKPGEGITGMMGRVLLWGEHNHSRVLVTATAWGHTAQAITGSDGSFAMTSIPPGYYYSISFAKDGFAQTRRDVIVGSGEFLELPEI